MGILLDVFSWVLILSGSAFLVIGGIGVVRLPDVFARMHGAGIIETMGACVILTGLMVQAEFTIVTIKLVMIVVFILFTSPTTTHALARAALGGGARPQVLESPEVTGDGEGEPPSKT
jgi:multicomponent Na+:H+ antiporter subunit G